MSTQPRHLCDTCRHLRREADQAACIVAATAQEKLRRGETVLYCADYFGRDGKRALTEARRA